MTGIAKRDFVLLAILVLATAAAYSPLLQAGYVWDDDVFVTENTSLRSADGLRRIWTQPSANQQYYPLTFTSFWVEYRLWGLSSRGYHITNVVLHLLNSILLWGILRRLSLPGAWLTAAAFALHPVQVESVAWITERTNTLSGFFYLAALPSYLVYTGSRAAPGGGRGRKRYYLLSLLLFVAALLSKSVTVTLPAAILLLCWWQEKEFPRREIRPLSLFLAFGALMGLVTLLVERYHVGAAWPFPAAERILTAGRAFWFYLQKLLWPSNLTFIYPKWSIDPTSWRQYLYPLAAVGLFVLLWRLRRRIGTGPFCALSLFAVTLAPVLGFIVFYMMRHTYVADHMLYLAAAAPLAAMAAVATKGAGRAGLSGALRTSAATAVLAVLGFLSWSHCADFTAYDTLWRDTIRKNHGAWLAHYSLGVWSEHNGRPEEALDHYRTAIGINPDDDMSHYRLGLALHKQGRYDAATEHLGEVVRIVPRATTAHKILGDALAALGRGEEALSHYRTALQIEPLYAECHTRIASVLEGMGRSEEGVAHLSGVLETYPYLEQTQNNLGVLLFRLGRYDEAASRFQQALSIRPDYAEAQSNLERALALGGRPSPALPPGRE